jgi:hypothetical protein
MHGVYVEKMPFHFSAEKSHFRPIAVILALLERFYAEMADEPLFYRGPLHLLSLQILLRMISCFTRGEKVRTFYIYSAIVQETLAKSWLFIKVTFRPLFRQCLKNGISTTVYTNSHRGKSCTVRHP